MCDDEVVEQAICDAELIRMARRAEAWIAERIEAGDEDEPLLRFVEDAIVAHGDGAGFRLRDALAELRRARLELDEAIRAGEAVR